MKATMTLVFWSELPWNGTDPNCINFDVWEYFPDTHVAQLPPAGPENPALHVQLVEAKLPTGELEFDGQAKHVEFAPTAVEYVPAPQSMHRADPVDVLYFPATHAVQVPPSAPE